MDKYVEKLVEIFKKSHHMTITGDSKTVYRLTLNQIDEVKALVEAEVSAKYLEHGIQTQSVQECHDRTVLKIAGDSLYNIANGFGTMLDPQTYTRPIMPVMCGAGDASAIYAGGGLPASIIDKKATAMVLDGSNFISDSSHKELFTEDKLQMLSDAAAETGFDDAAGDVIRDAYLYGGAILYPIFTHDSPSRLFGDVKNLKLEKGCVKRWVEVDRWNTVYVPSFIPTAADYLKPKSMMVLQESVEVNTSRMCIVRPRPQPYWAIIANMGWAPSDITGWLQSYYAYETTQMSIPVMAQQMSLILYRMPLDALNATIGANQVEKLMKVNEEQMKKWSALRPEAVNMVGEVEVVDRTYSGFEQFVGAIKSDLAAQCEIPEPSLWHTPNKGFSDNTQESLLKQSETLKMRQHYIERYMQVAKDMLVAHVFGSDSEEWQNRQYLKLKFDKPMITTEAELSDIGSRLAASVNSYVQAGISPDVALDICKKFFPSAKITDDMVKQIKKSYEERLEAEQSAMMSQTSLGGQGKAKGGATNRATNGTGSSKTRTA